MSARNSNGKERVVSEDPKRTCTSSTITVPKRSSSSGLSPEAPEFRPSSSSASPAGSQVEVINNSNASDQPCQQKDGDVGVGSIRLGGKPYGSFSREPTRYADVLPWWWKPPYWWLLTHLPHFKAEYFHETETSLAIRAKLEEVFAVNLKVILKTSEQLKQRANKLYNIMGSDSNINNPTVRAYYQSAAYHNSTSHPAVVHNWVLNKAPSGTKEGEWRCVSELIQSELASRKRNERPLGFDEFIRLMNNDMKCDIPDWWYQIS